MSESTPQQAPVAPRTTPRAAPLWLTQARARGWLPDAWSPSADEAEPSPLLATLVMLGALACSVPLLSLLYLQIRVLLDTAAGYVVGALALAAGLWWLRSSRHIFANCMALELWGLGLLLMLIRWMSDTHGGDAASFAASAFVSIVLLGSALLIPALWVVRLLGLALVNALMATLVLGLRLLGLPGDLLLVWLLVLPPVLALVWAGWCWREPRWLGRRLAPRVAALADGWAVGLLLFVVSNSFSWDMLMSFGLGGMEDGFRASWHWWSALPRGLAVLCALAGGWALTRRWSDRAALAEGGKPLLALSSAALALGAWFSPGVGTVALVAALAAASARWRLLVACGLVALWLLSRFYYSLAWSLAAKGVGLALLGAALILGLLALRRRATPRDATGNVPPRNPQRIVVGALLLGGVIALALANVDVWRKEAIIAHGQRILVPLAPVDPRSLMQGDYMQLRFAIPSQVLDELDDPRAVLLDSQAHVVARIDERGEAQVLRLAHPGETLDAHEITLPLKRLKGHWVLVTDAYFFPEGQGKPFEQARFGELRALPDGRALLVGLADAQGQAIAGKGGH